MDKKILRVEKIFPWYYGFGADLLFWIAIDTLFLDIVKKFTASQIVSITSISLIVSIVLQVPTLALIKYLGNTNSVRLGHFLHILSAILITFGPNYYFVLLGKILNCIGSTFQSMYSAILMNNLKLVDREEKFVLIRGRGATIYAIVTMLISFVASPIFNFNHYLPMYLCIFFTVVAFTFSLFIVDYSKNNKSAGKINVDEQKTPKNKIKLTKILILTVIAYGLCYALVSEAQSDGKLFVQTELFKSFSVNNVSLIIGIMVAISRIVRVFSNTVSYKIYKLFKEKIFLAISIAMLLSIISFIAFSFVKIIWISVIGMIFGYIIILFIRDPYSIYMQNFALLNCDPDKQKDIIALMQLWYKIFHAIMSLGFAAILKIMPMLTIMILMAALAVASIAIHLYLNYMITHNKSVKVAVR